jgi:hypothetical protein
MMKDKVEIMKEEVKKMLMDVDSFDLSHKLDCIDTLERLGLDYHYTEEIDKLMCNVFEAKDQDLDLPTTSHLFYLLRKHGYHISSGKILDKFCYYIVIVVYFLVGTSDNFRRTLWSTPSTEATKRVLLLQIVWSYICLSVNIAAA